MLQLHQTQQLLHMCVGHRRTTAIISRVTDIITQGPQHIVRLLREVEDGLVQPLRRLRTVAAAGLRHDPDGGGPKTAEDAEYRRLPRTVVPREEERVPLLEAERKVVDEDVARGRDDLALLEGDGISFDDFGLLGHFVPLIEVLYGV